MTNQTKQLSNELARLHAKAVELTALLEVIHAAMPEDKPEQEASYRFLLGMAHRMADDLQEQMDGLDVSLHQP